ncbi:N-acyl-D-amino-acid deacylase family protein [Dermatobacter hominis]|uniref:N-acyl-D-amino-acid deacylase family protein n=1 Tax=Dermatobacter hominis TaxID=2884263 RepID=UPI001D0FE25E|nr:amidohydrolase family protein [Dermatobacter hominis]UDY37215.1 amidohydrolase family protein [Dermatobacter hominis]
MDLAIRNVTIVDGTGAPSRLGDVGIADGRIAVVAEPGSGELDGAAEEVDATGLVLCPGFVDPHTHYDAQLLWDPTASPSSVHGVTTVIGGNCGFTLAPLAPGDGDYTRRMMAKVEGMPLAALEQGIEWDWETFDEYLARFDGNLAVNAGFLVGHCALRRRVMGADAVGSQPSDDQLRAMRDLLAESIRAGGLGFSTTRARTHSDGDGQPVASRWAEEPELLALAEVVSEHDGTTLEFASDGCLDGFDDDEVEFMIRFSKAGNRPLNWNVLTVDSHAPERYRNQLAAMDRAAGAGARVVALTMPVIVGMNMSFLNYCALNMMPDWGDILGLPVPERIEKLEDPATRRFMEERAASPDAGVFARLTGWDTYVIGDTFSPENEGLTGRRVGDIAAERGTTPFDALLDIVIADDLQTVLWPGATDADPESWELRRQAWQHPAVMLGGSDAGAHLDRMQGANYPTRFLADSLRGRKLTTLEDAVRMMTSVPAALFGLRDRGVIREGAHADLVLFDPEVVDSEMLSMVEDLPGGTGRLYAGSVGVRSVYVSGVEVVRDGAATDARPGSVIRSGVDTDTVTAS